MAEKKMTRAEALTIAIETCDNAEAKAILGKMLAQITKPREKSDTKSKARIENERLLAAMVGAIRAKGAPVTSKWVMEHVNGLMTPQKVTAVARIGLESGALIRGKDGKAVTYAVPTEGNEE